MNTITINRATVEQALEALEDAKALLNNKDRTTTMWFADEITALRAALAQQADTTDPGHDVDVLREHVRHLERRVRELHAQQAGTVPMPPFPPVSQWNQGCAVCGIGADGKAYGYVCPRHDCPTKVTCGGVV